LIRLCVNNGTTSVSSGTLYFAGAVSGTGTDTISGAHTLQFGSTVSTSTAIGSQTIDFSGGGGTLNLLDPKDFYGRISDFAATDTVELAGAWSKLNFVADAGSATLTMASGSIQQNFNFVVSFTEPDFMFSQVGGSTLITRR
jgi:hypothetical protein